MYRRARLLTFTLLVLLSSGVIANATKSHESNVGSGGVNNREPQLYDTINNAFQKMLAPTEEEPAQQFDPVEHEKNMQWIRKQQAIERQERQIRNNAKAVSDCDPITDETLKHQCVMKVYALLRGKSIDSDFDSISASTSNNPNKDDALESPQTSPGSISKALQNVNNQLFKLRCSEFPNKKECIKLKKEQMRLAGTVPGNASKAQTSHADATTLTVLSKSKIGACTVHLDTGGNPCTHDIDLKITPMPTIQVSYEYYIKASNSCTRRYTITLCLQKKNCGTAYKVGKSKGFHVASGVTESVERDLTICETD